MNWYNFVKFFHIIAVIMMIGGVFARQLVRGTAKKSNDVKLVASLTQVAGRIDRVMVIPGSSIVIVMGVILTVMIKWPIFGFLQGASENWLLVSNILLIIGLSTVFTIFVPHNRKLESILQTALAEGRITTELSAALDNKVVRLAHRIEEIAIIATAALMVLKPF